MKSFNIKAIRFLLFPVFGLIALAPVCQAVLSNTSFEDAPIADGAFNQNIPNWTNISAEAAGTFNPQDPQYAGTSGLPGLIPNGDRTHVASFFGSIQNLGLTGSISQATGDNLAANTIYTLTVAVGDRLDKAFQGYLIAILAGTQTVASSTSGGIPNGDGTFTDITLTYNSSAADALLIGLPISVVLGTSSGAGLNTAVDYDNVRFSVVPEPGSLWLAAITLGMLVPSGFRKLFPRSAQSR